MGLRDLAELAAEILARCRPDEPDEDPDKDFDDRSVKVQTTFQGAGVMHGDLTPECASIVGTVLDALAGLAGARTTGPRSSGTTTRSRRPCAAWSPAGCCRSGPGSRSRPWSTSPWPT